MDYIPVLISALVVEGYGAHRDLHSFPTRRSSDLDRAIARLPTEQRSVLLLVTLEEMSYEEVAHALGIPIGTRSEEHTSELQSHHDLVCRLLLEKKKKPLRAERRSTRRPSVKQASW